MGGFLVGIVFVLGSFKPWQNQARAQICHAWLIQVDPNPGVRSFGLIISLSSITGMLGCGGGTSIPYSLCMGQSDYGMSSQTLDVCVRARV